MFHDLKTRSDPAEGATECRNFGLGIEISFSSKLDHTAYQRIPQRALRDIPVDPPIILANSWNWRTRNYAASAITGRTGSAPAALPSAPASSVTPK